MALRGYIHKYKKALWTHQTPVPQADLVRAVGGRVQGRRIRSATTQMTERRRRYNARVKMWLKLPENKWCAVSKIPEMGMEGFHNILKATQCHHRRGRMLTKKGDLLFLESEWIPVSAAGHAWIDANKSKARELGLLAPVGEFNTWLKDL